MNSSYRADTTFPEESASTADATTTAKHRKLLAQMQDRLNNAEQSAGALRERLGINLGPRLFARVHRVLGPRMRLLVTGGSRFSGTGYSVFFTECELYDPDTDTWSETSALTEGRTWHRATVLQNGTVLVSGGYNDEGYLSSCELYEP